MAQGKLRKAVEKSISAGAKAGSIQTDRDAATIEMLRHMADMLDSEAGGPSVIRYVSPASFLAYCEKLGFVPALGQSKEEDTKAKVVQLVGNSKWKRA